MVGTPKPLSKWFSSPPQPNSSARLFCIPYSGCGASMYRQWPESYDGVDYCRLQPPGRENRFNEPALRTYEEMGEELADLLGPFLDVPYAFFGHCGSALAAYAITAALERRSMPRATNLFISSQVAPQDGPTGRWLTLTRAELGLELDKLTIAMGGTPMPDLRDVYLDILESDIAMNRRYLLPVPRQLRTRITTIGWTEDDEVDYRTMGGWAACGRNTFVLLDGPHQRFMQGPEELFAIFSTGLLAQEVPSS
jgi:surfactin synthase thioesterase subunit